MLRYEKEDLLLLMVKALRVIRASGFTGYGAGDYRISGTIRWTGFYWIPGFTGYGAQDLQDIKDIEFTGSGSDGRMVFWWCYVWV